MVYLTEPADIFRIANVYFSEFTSVGKYFIGYAKLTRQNGPGRMVSCIKGRDASNGSIYLKSAAFSLALVTVRKG
jgi:hypothetical protein